MRNIKFVYIKQKIDTYERGITIYFRGSPGRDEQCP